MGAQGSSYPREGATAVDAEDEGWTSMMQSYNCCDGLEKPRKPDVSTDIQFDAYDQNPRTKVSASVRASEAPRVQDVSAGSNDVYQLRRDSFIRVQRGSELLQAGQSTNMMGAPAQPESVAAKSGMECWRSEPQLHNSKHHHHHHSRPSSEASKLSPRGHV